MGGACDVGEKNRRSVSGLEIRAVEADRRPSGHSVRAVAVADRQRGQVNDEQADDGEEVVGAVPAEGEGQRVRKRQQDREPEGGGPGGDSDPREDGAAAPPFGAYRQFRRTSLAHDGTSNLGTCTNS